MTTQWRGTRVLELLVTKHGQRISQLTYEVSPGGQTLTVAGAAAAHDGYPATEQLSVFERVADNAEGIETVEARS